MDEREEKFNRISTFKREEFTGSSPLGPRTSNDKIQDNNKN